MVRLKTLICKAVGVLFSVAGGKRTLLTFIYYLVKVLQGGILHI